MAAMAMDMHFAGQREAALQLPVMTMEVKKKKVLNIVIPSTH